MELSSAFIITMVRGKQIKAKWPCGTCKKDCKSNCLFCEYCDNWFHIECENVSTSELKSLSAISEAYICSTCRNDENDFDFLHGLARLTKAMDEGFSKLQSVATREGMLVKENRMSLTPKRGHQLEPDTVANELLSKFTFETSGKAAKSSADGDCLFNAVSTQLIGDESLSTELGYRTCVEMICNRNNILSHKQRACFSLLSPSYDDSCKSCAKFGNGYSSIWVIQNPVKLIYLAVNGFKDFAVIKLNTTIQPITVLSDNADPIKIMWTNILPPIPGKTWVPNHFVPIVDLDSIQQGIPEDNVSRLMNSTPNCTSTSINQYSPGNFSKKRLISPNESIILPKRRKTLSLSTFSLSPNTSFVTPKRRQTSSTRSISPLSFESRNMFESLSEEIEEVEIDNMSDDDVYISDNDILKKAPVPNKFMSNVDVMKTVLETESLADHVPLGQKDNVFVVLDNTRNDNKKKADFPDDCGSWCSDTGTTANQYYTLSENNKLTTVFKQNNTFGIKKKTNGKTVFVQCDPQPQRYLCMHRYYTSLRGENEYKKRITTFTDVPSDLEKLKNIALIEYSGVRKRKNIPHGNSKSKAGYVRTDPKILEECAFHAKTKPATEVCYMMAKDNSVIGPKSAKQINDKIYKDKKKQNQPQNKNSNNIADEVLSIVSQVHAHPSIQKVETSLCKQMTDLKSNCSGEGGSVLGVDRTFNLGKCFVTTFTYKNQSVVHTKSGENPIMLGPLFLHWDGEMKTYHSFFSHVRAELGNVSVTIGSDEERAMTNALHDCFPNGTFLLCTKHIKENTGTELKDRQRIVKIIFGEDGIVFSKNDLEYESRKSDLEQYFEKNNKFENYYQKYLESKLKAYVIAPLREKKISNLWTNNNSESINNRLKQVADFKQHKLPDLVEKMALVSNIQILDLRRALHGTGNFRLEGKTAVFEVEQEVWNVKSQKEKQEYFQKFLATKKNIVNASNFAKASGTDFSCPKPKQSCGRKPCQRKRQKSERTKTVKNL